MWDARQSASRQFAGLRIARPGFTHAGESSCRGVSRITRTVANRGAVAAAAADSMSTATWPRRAQSSRPDPVTNARVEMSEPVTTGNPRDRAAPSSLAATPGSQAWVAPVSSETEVAIMTLPGACSGRRPPQRPALMTIEASPGAADPPMPTCVTRIPRARRRTPHASTPMAQTAWTRSLGGIAVFAIPAHGALDGRSDARRAVAELTDGLGAARVHLEASHGHAFERYGGRRCVGER